MFHTTKMTLFIISQIVLHHLLFQTLKKAAVTFVTIVAIEN